LFGMMVAPPADALTEAMSNRRPVTDSTVEDPRVPYSFCQDFLRAFPEFAADGSDRVQFVAYDRYILGMRILGRILLSIMPVQAMRWFLLALLYGLLAAIALIAAWRLLRSPPAIAARARAAAFIAIPACLALFYGLSYYGPTLNFGALDATHFAFILVSLLVPLGETKPITLAIAAATYGSLVAFFEFLTGGIPFALAMLPLLLALGFRGGARSYGAKLAVLWGSFCLAVVVAFALKMLLAHLFFAGRIAFIGPLTERMFGAFGPLPNAPDTSWGSVLRYLPASYGYQSRNIAWGSWNLGRVVVPAALCTILIVTWRHRKALRTFGQPVVAAVWLSLGALIAWVVVFFNHTATHPFSQVRLLAIPILAASVLVATEIVSWRPTRQAPRERTR
jgi:hypothetical protein